jgi:Flp pilus assembly protein TadG
MMLLMGSIDYGFYFLLDNTVTNAAREGARVGAVASTEALAETDAESAATEFLSVAGLSATVDATAPASSNSWNLSVEVTVDSYSGVTGFLPAAMLPSSITYTAVMHWENAPL